MSEELLPCPFCGEIPELWQVPRKSWYVDCRTEGCCNPGTYNDFSKEMAIKQWNTRTEKTK